MRNAWLRTRGYRLVRCVKASDENVALLAKFGTKTALYPVFLGESQPLGKLLLLLYLCFCYT